LKKGHVSTGTTTGKVNSNNRAEVNVSILSDFEDRLGSAIEGAFSSVFRSPVQPAELARAASKEMARSRKLGIDKIYVANVYSVFISARDAEALGGLTATLEGELETYLLAYAREHDFQLATRPLVRFATDEELKLGRFDVIGEQLSVAEIFEELGSVPGVTDDLDAGANNYEASASTPAHSPRQSPGNRQVAPPCLAQIAVPGRGLIPLEPEHLYTIGRQRACDIFVDDANISRRHAQLGFNGRDWEVKDLGSTNGTSVNGRSVAQTRLRSGDCITVGISELKFSESTPQ
jgi:hypothetical protein